MRRELRDDDEPFHLVVLLDADSAIVEELLKPGGLLLQSAELDFFQEWELESKSAQYQVRRRPSPSDCPIDWAFPEDPSRGFSLVMPFYNEEEGCRRTISELYEALELSKVDFEIVAVDNGSTDRTPGLLSEMSQEFPKIRVVSVFPNRGYGWGILRGLASCEGQSVAYMGGDGQVAPADVVSLLNLYRTGCVDMAKVRRIKRGDGLTRAGISVIFNLLFSLATGYLESDTNASPKILERSRLTELKLKSKDWFLDAELMMKVRSQTWRVVELDVHFLPREAGSSYVRPGTLLEFLKNLFRAGLRLRSGRGPTE